MNCIKSFSEIVLSRFAISRLLYETLRASGKDPYSFVEVLGLHRFSTSAKRLITWIETGEGNESFLNDFARARNCADEVSAAIEITKEQKNRQRAANNWLVARRQKKHLSPLFISIQKKLGQILFSSRRLPGGN